MDSCPAPHQIENLKSVKLFFFPPNITSQIQPMDQGVILSLNAQYRKNVLRKIIWSVEKKETPKKTPLLLGMQISLHLGMQ